MDEATGNLFEECIMKIEYLIHAFDDGEPRKIEYWHKDNMCCVQDVLCRGIVGTGKTIGPALRDLEKHLSGDLFQF
jgi:hypothetical protein